MTKRLCRTLIATLCLIALSSRSTATVFDREIDTDTGFPAGDYFSAPFPDLIFNIGETHTFNLTFADDKRLRVEVSDLDSHFQVALNTHGPSGLVATTGGPLVAPYAGSFATFLLLGEEVVGFRPPGAPVFVPPGALGIPVSRDFDAAVDLIPPGEVVEFDSIKIDWLPSISPHPNSANANFLSISALGGMISVVDDDPPPPTFETLYWSGAAGTPQYAAAANWGDSDTTAPSPLSPAAATALLFDHRLNGGPPTDPFTYTPIELDGALKNEAASVTVFAARYELAKKTSSTSASLQVGGPVAITGESADSSTGLTIRGGTTMNLTPGGAGGDVSVSVDTSLGNIGLLVYGALVADEIVLNVPADANGQRSLVVSQDDDVAGSSGSIEARVLNVQHSTASATMFRSTSTANITERILVGGELALFSGAVVNTPLVDISLTGRLVGGGFGFGAPGQLNADVKNAGTLAPGSSSFFAGGTAGPYLISGDYEQTATGQFEVHLDGATSSRFDNVTITGDATLAGSLVASVASGSSFVPTEFALERGMEFLVMNITGGVTGVFDGLPQNSLVFNDPASGLDVFIDYFAGSGNDVRLFTLPVLGDYDGNDLVDAADYDAWKAEFGSVVILPGSGADGNGDGIVDAADYVVWRDQLGTLTAPPASTTALPEPGALLLLLVVVTAGYVRMRNTSSTPTGSQ